MYYNKRSNPSSMGCGILLLITGLIFARIIIGFSTGGTGPTNNLVVTVESKHIDTSHKESHYMVVTDKGAFEVANGLFLGIYNADEVYGHMQQGKTYAVTTKGVRMVNLFMQEYPYIVSATETATTNPEK